MSALRASLLALCLIASTTGSPTPTNLMDLQAVTQGAQSFASNFVKTVAKEKQGNLICSPLSLHVALSMTAIGASGSTEAQFKDVLKLPADKTQTLSGYHNLIETLNNVENVTLKLANKLFVKNGFPVKPEFKQELQTYYLSDIESVDFSQTAKATNTINNWCKEKTNNRIDSIVKEDDITPDTALVLTNAVYFKGNWRDKFDPNATTDRPFHIDANNVINIPTMYRKGDYKYVALPEYEAKCIELPYANEEVSMVIILPDKIDGLAALTDKLAEVTADCSTRLAQTYEREVRVYLPKFKIESELDLADTLSKKMGLSEPFSNANFSKISDVALKIDKVIQKAFIEVNEEGSEAAAVTGISNRRFLPDFVNFDANKPFSFVVRASNNLELFRGQVYNPRSQQDVDTRANIVKRGSS